MRPSIERSPARCSRLAAFLGAILLLPVAAAAESSVAAYDAELEAVASPAEVDPEGTSTVHILLRNRGDFGIDDAVVAVRLPTTLELVSAEPSRGSYDVDGGEWTTGEVLSFDLAELSLTVRATSGASSATLSAELMSAESSFAAYDVDSTPGNGDPCEDDQATATITVTGAPDGGPGEGPDAGPACPEPPDAGPVDDRPDAGLADAATGPGAADAGAGGGGDDGCGCSGTGEGRAAGALALLLAVLVAHLPRRRREPRRGGRPA